MVPYFLFVLVSTAIICLFKYVLTKNHDYWKKRNIPYLKPLPLFGNYKEAILLKKHQAQVAQDICKHFPDEPYIGTFYGTAPALIIQDPELIKLVFVTDFYYFSGREVSDYSHKETITKNLFFTAGDNWKIQRQNLTPLFSSTKIKGMFHLILECANQLKCLLGEETRMSPIVNVKNLLSKYAIDCTTSTVFGINSNTMSTDTVMNPFMILREKIFESSKIRGMKFYCRQMWPALFYGLRFSVFSPDISKFFNGIISGVFQARQNTNSTRNDFIDQILTWKDKKVISGESLSNEKTGGKKMISLEVTDELLIAQCVALFSAGFETTAGTLAFALFEIAKNQDVQEKVIKEVDAYLEKHNGMIEYECVNELPYITACIDEILRLYPVLGVITREVMDDYTFPTGLHVQKGDRIHIPVNEIHRNPNFFPEPDVFRPERFYGDEKKSIKPFTFYSFGEGPRICVGFRFSKMTTHASFLTIFKNYRVELAENMPHSVKLEPISMVTSSATPIELKLISRKT